MSKRKDDTTSLPVHPRPASDAGGDRKLSDIIKEMALRLLKDPDADTSEPATLASLMLAGVAWNSALGDNEGRNRHRTLVSKIDWAGVSPWSELRSADTDRLIDELVAYKREHYADDRRHIVASELTPEGNVRVHWTAPANVIAAAFESRRARAGATRSTMRRSRPVADKLVKNMNAYVHSKVVDLGAVMAGRKNAEEMQKTVASREELADMHPAHAFYVHAQNQVSVMSEQLAPLKEMVRFVEMISKAEDEYLPSGPPMSPLTKSFFTCWAFFDACVGRAEETLGTTVLSVGTAFGLNSELARVIGLMQDSRMAVHAHEGFDGERIVLRELVTNEVCKVISPSGYRGRKGELWYARVLPPPHPEFEEHVVFTTPYLLIDPGEREWLAYFQRTLSGAGDRIAAYEHHMKFGPARDYWTEFVFEAYVNHRSDVIFLKGLPDMPESRPHSRVNR